MFDGLSAVERQQVDVSDVSPEDSGTRRDDELERDVMTRVKQKTKKRKAKQKKQRVAKDHRTCVGRFEDMLSGLAYSRISNH